MTTRLNRITLLPDDSDEEQDPTTTRASQPTPSARHPPQPIQTPNSRDPDPFPSSSTLPNPSYQYPYPRPSTSRTRATSSRSERNRPSTAADSAYDPSSTWQNQDESRAAPPLPTAGGASGFYARELGLEEPQYRNSRLSQEERRAQRGEGVGESRRSADQRPRKSRESSARRRRNVAARDDGEGEGLTEVEAPPPVPRTSDLGGSKAGAERTGYLEDEERRRGGDDDDNGDAADQSAHDTYAYHPNNQESSNEAASPPPPLRQNPPLDSANKTKTGEIPKWLTTLYTLSYLILFAILGTLARLGTQWLTFYPGAPIATPVVWANFGGSLIMGFLSEDQGLFRPEEGIEPGTEQVDQTSPPEKPAQKQGQKQGLSKAEATKRKKAIPVYIGLATGFCGSYTSFSSFARDFMLALANRLPYPVSHPHPGYVATTTETLGRSGGYSFEAFLAVVIYTLALSLGGLVVGAQLAVFADPITPRIHGRWFGGFVDPGVVVLGWGCWLGAVLLAIFPPQNAWRSEVVFALVFAPLGCILRWYLSAQLNSLVPTFPLGTFAANMFGTAVEAMCYSLQHIPLNIAAGRIGGGVVGCGVLQGVQDGFCGCLTTVSTWVSEINGLKRRQGWVYAFVSLCGALGLMVVILGSCVWSLGFGEAGCNTGYPSKVHG